MFGLCAFCLKLGVCCSIVVNCCFGFAIQVFGVPMECFVVSCLPGFSLLITCLLVHACSFDFGLCGVCGF